MCDRAMASALNLDRTLDPAMAVALLLEKLLLYAGANGMIPIVGRHWAESLLEAKLSWIAPGTDRSLMPPNQASTYAAFSAGLSLDFLDDHKLTALSFERLRHFKDSNRDLLSRHQLHLTEVAREYQSIETDHRREPALQDLRLKAIKKRAELDDEARTSVRSLGLDLLKKGIDSATSKEGMVVGVATALALNHSAIALLGGAFMAGVGQSISGLVEIWKTGRERRQTNAFAYLFATRSL
jgi:hypothetical protein